jgi:hypothetical protein
VFVLTVDQMGSRHAVDHVEDALAALAGLEAAAPFARTVGDEFQGALADPAAVVDAVVTLLRSGHWHVGLGIGPVEAPLPVDPRAGRGPAFLAARAAVERAKREPSHLCVVSAVVGTEATDAGVAFQLLAALYQRRTSDGWEAIEEVRRGASQASAAARLGISRQAVGQRLRAAGWSLEQQGLPVVARLLARADAAASDGRGASGPTSVPA